MNKKFNIKNTGFKAPKAYFDTLEDKILNKINEDTSFEHIKESGFKLPDGYLSSVEDAVLNTVNEQDNKVISLLSRRNLLYVSGIAAAIVIMFGIFMKNDTISEPLIDAEMAETYLMNQDISSYELASLLTEEDIVSLDEEIMNEAFTDDEMEDYLLENVNLEDIIEQ